MRGTVVHPWGKLGGRRRPADEVCLAAQRAYCRPALTVGILSVQMSLPDRSSHRELWERGRVSPTVSTADLLSTLLAVHINGVLLTGGVGSS